MTIASARGFDAERGGVDRAASAECRGAPRAPRAVEGEEHHVGLARWRCARAARGASSGLPLKVTRRDLARGARPFALEGLLHAARERRGRGDHDRRVPAVGHGEQRRLARLLLERQRDREEIRRAARRILAGGWFSASAGWRAHSLRASAGGAVAREAAPPRGCAPAACAWRQASSSAAPLVVDVHEPHHGRRALPATSRRGGEALAHRVGEAAERRRGDGQDERDVRPGAMGASSRPGAWVAGRRGRGEQGAHDRAAREARLRIDVVGARRRLRGGAGCAAGCAGRPVGRECRRQQRCEGEKEDRVEARHGQGRCGLRYAARGRAAPRGIGTRIICGRDSHRESRRHHASRATRDARARRLVAAEDTRVTRGLLAHFGIARPRGRDARAQRARARPRRSCARSRRDERVALVSDAGTPGGERSRARVVVERVRAAGLRVVPDSGRERAHRGAFARAGSRPTASCSRASCPRRARERQRQARRARRGALGDRALRGAAPHRARRSRDLHAALGERDVVIARELTKRFETHRAPAARAGARLGRGRPRSAPRRVRARDRGPAAPSAPRDPIRARSSRRCSPNCRSSRRWRWRRRSPGRRATISTPWRCGCEVTHRGPATGVRIIAPDARNAHDHAAPTTGTCTCATARRWHRWCGATARQFARAIVMPNLKPPVITVAQAAAYRERILAALPRARPSSR